MEFFGLYNYWAFAVLLMIGMYIVMSRANLIKKLIGLTIFQSAMFLLYISMDKVEGGTAPILQVTPRTSSTPIPCPRSSFSPPSSSVSPPCHSGWP